MMEVYRIPSKESQDILLASVVCSEVIEGLNRYFASEPRNNYISIWPTVNKRDFVLYEPEAWADILIEWLRKKHDIFYRPGLTLDQVEAARSAAKMCCLRAHIKDEISKRGLLCGADEDVPALVDTLFKAYDECVKHRDKNRKDAVKLSEEIRCVVKEKESAIKKFKGRIAELEYNFKAVCDEDDIFRTRALKAEEEVKKLKEQLDKVEGAHKEAVCKDIMKYIRQEATRNGFELPEEIDGEPLTIKRVFHDLLELLRQHETKIRNAERETRKAVNDQLKKDTDYVADTLCDILEALGISKSNTAHLDIPGLKTKAIQRATCIKSEHDRYLEQLDKAAADYQALSEENQKLKNAEKSDTNKLIRDYCTKNDIIAPSRYLSDEACIEYLFLAIEQKDRKEVEDAQKEAKQECYKYLWDRLRVLSPECDALKITDYEKLVDRIFYEMSLINDNCKRCQRKHTTEKFDYIRRMNKAEEEVKKLKEQKDRAAAILQDLYRDIFKRQPDGLSAEDIANKILDRMLETEDLLHKSVDSVNKECKATGKLMVADYELKLKDYILKDIRKHGYRYDGLEKESIEEIVDWIITMATCPRNEWAKDEIENLRGKITTLKDLINAMNEEVRDM